MTNESKIIIQAQVAAPVEKVWECYTKPEHIVHWNFASADWHSPRAENDLCIGGVFKYRMEARDGGEGFDFTGTYTHLTPHKHIAYTMDDGRSVRVDFNDHASGVTVVIAFDPESQNTIELQRQGWQAILDNFKKYVESF